MKPSEINKFMLWILGVFPQWKADKITSAAWSDVLGDISANVAIAATKKLMTEKPSSYPPSVFSIKEILTGKTNKELEAKIEFNKLWATACGTKACLPTKKAIAAQDIIGDDYKDCLIKDKPWHERRFVDIYIGLGDRESREEGALLLSGEVQKQIEGG